MSHKTFLFFVNNSCFYTNIAYRPCFHFIMHVAYYTTTMTNHIVLETLIFFAYRGWIHGCALSSEERRFNCYEKCTETIATPFCTMMWPCFYDNPFPMDHKWIRALFLIFFNHLLHRSALCTRRLIIVLCYMIFFLHDMHYNTSTDNYQTKKFRFN